MITNSLSIARIPIALRRKSWQQRKGSAGFTLIELLTTIAVTALIATLAFSIAAGVLATWSNQLGQLTAERQADFIFEQLAADLQSSLTRTDAHVWFAASVLDRSDNSGVWQTSPRQKPAGSATGSLNLAAPTVDGLRFGQAGVWLRFFTSGLGSNGDRSTDLTTPTVSAPTAVSYQLIRRAAPLSGSARYFLHRSLVRPAQSGARPGALEAGYDLDPEIAESAYSVTSLSNDGSQEDDPCAIRGPILPEAVVGENVVDFGLRLYVRDASTGALTIIFPLGADDFSHLGRSSATGVSLDQRYPEVVDVMLRVLTDDGARQLTEIEGENSPSRPSLYPSDAAWWWGVVLANSNVFYRRFEMGATGL